MRPVLFALICLVAGSAHGQTTWHNLQFGETRDNIRTQLSDQGIATELSSEGSLESTNDYELFLPGLRNTLPLHTSYHFTPNGRLMDVTLALDLNAMRRNFNEAPAGADLADFAAQHLAGALAGRYGAPLYRSPACDAAAGKEPGTCVLFWNGPQQSILMEHDGPRVFVRYQMLASDL